MSDVSFSDDVLVVDYLGHLANERRLSRHTVKAYARDLANYLASLGPTPAAQASGADVRMFAARLHEDWKDYHQARGYTANKNAKRCNTIRQKTLKSKYQIVKLSDSQNSQNTADSIQPGILSGKKLNEYQNHYPLNNNVDIYQRLYELKF